MRTIRSAVVAMERIAGHSEYSHSHMLEISPYRETLHACIRLHSHPGSGALLQFHLFMHLTHLLRRGAMSGERYGCNGWIPHTPGSMNIYGSEGPFSLSRPLGLHSLDTGTLISMVQLSGNPTSVEAHGLPPHHCVRQNIEIETLCCAFTRLLTKHLMVPDDCISYVWGHVRQTSCDKVVTVAVIFNSLQDGVSSILQDDDNWEKCFICASPCEDADAPYSTHSREGNCLECGPCSLCDYCSFPMADGSPKCLYCFEPEDICYFKKTYSAHVLRARMLTAWLDWSSGSEFAAVEGQLPVGFIQRRRATHREEHGEGYEKLP